MKYMSLLFIAFALSASAVELKVDNSSIHTIMVDGEQVMFLWGGGEGQPPRHVTYKGPQAAHCLSLYQYVELMEKMSPDKDPVISFNIDPRTKECRFSRPRPF